MGKLTGWNTSLQETACRRRHRGKTGGRRVQLIDDLNKTRRSWALKEKKSMIGEDEENNLRSKDATILVIIITIIIVSHRSIAWLQVNPTAPPTSGDKYYGNQDQSVDNGMISPATYRLI